MNSSLIYKSPMIANEFSFEQSKPLPLGKRLIDACITNETTMRSGYLVFYVTSKSFSEDWEKFIDSILSDLTEQELDDQYGVTSKSEARSNLDKWKTNLLGDNRLGYLIVRAETPFKKRPSKISYIDSMTYVCTTPPNQKGQEKVIVPQVKEDPSITIQCLKSDSYMQDPFSYTVRLSKGFATYKGIDGKQREFLFDGLSKIKSQLFDAPAEVKEAFNNVVNYFDKKELEHIDPSYVKNLQETILKSFSHNREDNSLDSRCENLGLFKNSKNTPKIVFNKDNIDISIEDIKAIIYPYVTYKVGIEGWRVVKHRELNLQINRLPDKDTLDRIFREGRLSLNCELKLKGARNPKIIISRPRGGDDLRSLVSCAACLIKWIYGNTLNPELFRFK